MIIDIPIEKIISPKRLKKFDQIKETECGCCSKIYYSFDDFRHDYPLCECGGLVYFYNEEKNCADIVFYVPCKDSCYDKWFIFDYCPKCGRKLN